MPTIPLIVTHTVQTLTDPRMHIHVYSLYFIYKISSASKQFFKFHCTEFTQDRG